MKNSIKVALNEKNRIIVSWTLIISTFALLIALIAYNSSAIMILFDKGNLDLQSYDKLVQTVKKKSSDFTKIQQQGSDESGSIYYETKNGLASFYVVGVQNKIQSIDTQINLDETTNLNVIEAYRTIDSVLKPFFNKSDVLAAEILLIKTANKVALSGQFTNPKGVTLRVPVEQYFTNIKLEENSLKINMST